MQSLANRKGIVESISANRGRTQLEATIPTRGLIGFEFELQPYQWRRYYVSFVQGIPSGFGDIRTGVPVRYRWKG